MLLAGGFGSGKSTAGQAKIVLLKGVNGKIPGLIVAQTLGELHANIIDPMLEVIARAAPHDMRPRFGGGTARDPKMYLEWPDGQRTYLGSAKDPKSYAGINVGWAYGDEARLWSEAAWLLFESRVRLRCALSQIALTSTPALNWLHRAFDRKAPRREVIRCPTRLNIGNLRDGYVTDLEQSYSLRMRAAFLDGEDVVLSGGVYEQLGPRLWESKHAIDWAYSRPERTYLWIDPGFRRSSWLFVQRMPGRRWVIFDQLQLDDTSDYAAVAMVNAKKYAIDEIWTDPAADNVQGALGLDTIAMLQGIKTRGGGGVHYIAAPFRDIAFGIDKVRVMFDGEKPKLVFARSLRDSEDATYRGVVKSLMSYRYPDEKEDHQVRDVPLKDGVNDHACDSVRYGTLGLWSVELQDLDPRIAAMLRTAPGFGHYINARA